MLYFACGELVPRCRTAVLVVLRYKKYRELCTLLVTVKQGTHLSSLTSRETHLLLRDAYMHSAVLAAERWLDGWTWISHASIVSKRLKMSSNFYFRPCGPTTVVF